MKKKGQYTTMILAVVSLTILIVSGVAANSQQKPGEMQKDKMSEHQHGMMEMSGMMQEPHHLLAMAYKDNLVSFAKALRHHAAEAKTVNPEFARAAVAEMKRSFDRMQDHHQDHMKTMDESTKAKMADMMKQMDAHHSAIKEHLAALDKEVETSAPDAKSITEHVDEILKQCDGMSKMHGEMMDHKMAAPKDHKMN
jgi:O-methyltransferase involved in polyketide biosynthesis